MYDKISAKSWRRQMDVSYCKVLKLCVNYSMTKQRVSAKKTITKIKWNHKKILKRVRNRGNREQIIGAEK